MLRSLGVKPQAEDAIFSDEAHTVRALCLPVSHVSVDAGRSCQVFVVIMLGLFCF